MKIKELKENYTTATSVGNIAYTTANRGKFHLKKRREDSDHDEIIATIQRENKRGWRFKPTKAWHEQDLPHMGHVFNKKIRRRGKKTIEQNIEDTLKELGINYDSIEKEVEDQ